MAIFNAEIFDASAFAAKLFVRSGGEEPEPAEESPTRNLVIGMGTMPKQRNHPHPLFNKITG
jgi:hypothetical protein